MASLPVPHYVLKAGLPPFFEDLAGHALVASPSSGDGPLVQESQSRYCLCLHLPAAESKMTVYFYLERAWRSTQSCTENQTAHHCHQAAHPI